MIAYALVLFVGFMLGVAIMLAIGQAKLKRLGLEKDYGEKLNRTAHILDTKTIELRKQEESLVAKEREFSQRVIAFENLKKQNEMQHLAKEREFSQKIITHEDLKKENALLRSDVAARDANQRFSMREVELQRAEAERIASDGAALGKLYLAEVQKWIGQSITAHNYAACKQRLSAAIERVRKIGYEVPADQEAALLKDLQNDFEAEVRKAMEREEQARIKARLREEALRQKEVDQQSAQLAREQEAIAVALEMALADTTAAHQDEIAELRARLALAEQKQRAIAQAQLTKTGNIYIISNIGSFGEEVYKIGMTRRLEPLDRIDELGDASVPFPFDVHAMIASDDAPALEYKLHHAFAQYRINKVNPRKEYFRVPLVDVIKFVTEHHGDVQYKATAEAIEYRQSVSLTDAERQEIDQAFDRAEQQLGINHADE